MEIAAPAEGVAPATPAGVAGSTVTPGAMLAASLVFGIGIVLGVMYLSDAFNQPLPYIVACLAAGAGIGGLIFVSAKREMARKAPESEVVEVVNEGKRTRVPCPHCAEGVDRAATVCPFCKNAIFSHDKGKNAAATLVWTVVVFVVLYLVISQFVSCETERTMKSLRLGASMAYEQSGKPV